MSLLSQKKLCSCPSLPIINYLWADNTQLIITLFSSSMGVMTTNMAWQRIRWRLISLVTETQACFRQPPPETHYGAHWKSVTVSWICGSEARERKWASNDLISDKEVVLAGPETPRRKHWDNQLKDPSSASGFDFFFTSLFTFSKIQLFEVYGSMNFGNCVTTTQTQRPNHSLVLKGILLCLSGWSPLEDSHRKPVICCHISFAIFRISCK